MDRKEPQRVRRMFRARTLMLGQQFLHDKDNVSQFDREQKRLRPATLLFFLECHKVRRLISMITEIDRTKKEQKQE